MTRASARWVQRLLLAWAAAAWLAAPARASDLDIAVSKGPVSLVIYVAQAMGHFEREGLKPRFHDCTSGRDCYKLLASGQVQVATAADVVATLNSFSRDDLAFIASISTSSHQIKLIARKSAGITSPDSLQGKRIGTVTASSAQYFLSSWLLFHNIDPERVRVVSLLPDQITPAFQRGEIDAVSIWEPAAASALQALGDDGMAMPNPRVYTQHFGLITTRAIAAAKEAHLLQLLRALIRAEAVIAQNPDKAREILMEKLGVTREQAQLHLKEHDYRIRLDQSLVSTMSSQRRWASQEKLVPPAAAAGTPPRLTAEPRLLRRVAPAAVTLAQ